VSGGERTSGGATGSGEPKTPEYVERRRENNRRYRERSAGDFPSARSSRRRDQKRLNVFLVTSKPWPVSFDAQRIVRFDNALRT
jgi:hypothetical protein